MILPFSSLHSLLRFLSSKVKNFFPHCSLAGFVSPRTLFEQIVLYVKAEVYKKNVLSSKVAARVSSVRVHSPSRVFIKSKSLGGLPYITPACSIMSRTLCHPGVSMSHSQGLCNNLYSQLYQFQFFKYILISLISSKPGLSW